MKKLELRQTIKEEIKFQNLLTEVKTHTAKDWNTFMRWFPEIQPNLYKHFKLEEITITVQGGAKFTWKK